MCWSGRNLQFRFIIVKYQFCEGTSKINLNCIWHTGVVMASMGAEFLNKKPKTFYVVGRNTSQEFQRDKKIRICEMGRDDKPGLQQSKSPLSYFNINRYQQMIEIKEESSK